MDKLFDFSNCMPPPENAMADECVNHCIVMFSNPTRRVTMQDSFRDGRLPSVDMSPRVAATYGEGLDGYVDENSNIVYG